MQMMKKPKAMHEADCDCEMCHGGKMAKGGMVKYSKDAEQKGINKSVNTMHEGESHAGAALRRGAPFVAKEIHKDKLKEMKEMPDPKLQGLADGGPVLSGAQTAQDSMRKAFHFDEGGEVNEDHELHDMVGSEMMDAIHSKDHKKMMQGLEAMVLSCMNKRGED